MTDSTEYEEIESNDAEFIFAAALHAILKPNEGITVRYSDEIVAVRKYVNKDGKELIIIESYDELNEFDHGQWLKFDGEDEEIENELENFNLDSDDDINEEKPIVH